MRWVRPPEVRRRTGDPRRTVAAVTLGLHVLGQTSLDFAVSVPQIVAAIAAGALTDLIGARLTGRGWIGPASGMLTGSGVGLVLRLVGTEPGDHWATTGWHVFAVVAAGSVASKYVIRRRDRHLLNPSNAGLVVAFLLLGSARAEPLDLWWGPLSPGLVAAYLLIVVGGVSVNRRLGLLRLVAAFGATFTAAAGVLAAWGHCFTARWSFEPVCGTHLWWILVTSPEVFVFAFFMLTDPRTIPSSPRARVVFGSLVGFGAVLALAPFDTEFGAKVALLATLTVATAARSAIERAVVSDPGRPDAREGRGAARPRPATVGAVIALALVAAAALVVAGAPARRITDADPLPAVAGSPPVGLPPGVEVAVTPTLAEMKPEVAADAERVAASVLHLLDVEARAVSTGDSDTAAGVTSGERRQAAVAAAAAIAKGKARTWEVVDPGTVTLTVVWPEGRQNLARVGVAVEGRCHDLGPSGVDPGGVRDCTRVVAVAADRSGRWFLVAGVDDPLLVADVEPT